MPDLTAFAAFLKAYWYYFLTAAGVIGLLVFYGAAYVRALRPREGTLEWISSYDRPVFSIAGQWRGLEKRDVLPLLCACVVAAGMWGFAAWRSFFSTYIQGGVSTAVAVEAAIYYCAAPLATAVCTYLLLKGLFGQTMVSLLGTLVLAMDLTADPLSLLFSVLTALLLTRFLTTDGDAGFGEGCLMLILAFVVAAVGCYFQPALVIVAGAALLILLAGCAGRFVQLGSGWLVRSVVTALLAFGVTMTLIFVPAAVTNGMAFPKLLVTGDFYVFAAKRFLLGARNAFTGNSFFWVISAAYYDWPLLLCGLTAAVAAVARLIARRDYRGLVTVGWYVALAALWLAGGVYALPLGSVLCIGGVWEVLCRREKRYWTVLGAVCLLALLSLLYLYSWVLG